MDRTKVMALKPHLRQRLRHQGVGWSSKTKVLEERGIGGLPESTSSLPTPKCPGTQGSPGVVWLVLGPHHSHTQGSRCGGRATKDGFAQERPWVCRETP